MRRFILNIIPSPGGLLSHITCACTCTWESGSHKATQKCLQLPPCAYWFKQRCYSACHMLYVLCVRYTHGAGQMWPGIGIKRSGRQSQLIAKLLMLSDVSLGAGLTVEESAVLTGPDVKVNTESPDTKSTEKLTWQLRIRDPCQSD